MRRRRTLAALVLSGAVLLTVAVGSRAAARHVLFRGAPAPRAVPTGLDARVTTARDGALVHMLQIAARRSGGRTVVFFHNNRETVEARAELAREISARGLGVLLVEYRGYGASAGEEATEEGLYLDGEAGLDLLARDGVPRESIILFGVSLGTGVAAEMARRGRGGALVLVTPYTSIPDLVAEAVPFLPARLLVEDGFATLEKAPHLRLPTLVVHGDADEVVPFWMGERVAGAIPGARLLRVPGGRHGDLFVREGARILDALVRLGELPREGGEGREAGR